MKEIDYPVLLRMISDHEINLDGLWLEDINGVKWFWKDGNFMTGMREYDTEPPLLYLCDKYSVTELYKMRFKLPEVRKPKQMYNKLTVEDIIDKYSEGDQVIQLIDHKGDEWQYVPLTKCIINGCGENITEYYNELTLANMQFEVVWTEPSIQKQEAKLDLVGEVERYIKEVEINLNALKKTLNLYKNID